MNKSWLQKTSGGPKHNFCLKCWNILNYFVKLSHTNSIQQLQFWWLTNSTSAGLFGCPRLSPKCERMDIMMQSPQKLKLKKLPAFAVAFVRLTNSLVSLSICLEMSVTLITPSLSFDSFDFVRSVRRLAMPPCRHASTFQWVPARLALAAFPLLWLPTQVASCWPEMTLKDRTGPKMRIWDVNYLIQHKTAILSSWHKCAAKRGFLHQFLTLSQVSSRCHPNFIKGTTETLLKVCSRWATYNSNDC